MREDGRVDDTARTGFRYCPSCEGEFLAHVETCPDCGVPLTSTAPAQAAPPEADHRLAELDLSRLHDSTRVLLARLLDGDGIAHQWDGDRLIVSAAKVPRVEEIVASLDDPPPDEDAPGAPVDAHIDRPRHSGDAALAACWVLAALTWYLGIGVVQGELRASPMGVFVAPICLVVVAANWRSDPRVRPAGAVAVLGAGAAAVVGALT